MADSRQGTWCVLIIDEEGDFSKALGVYLSGLGLHILTASLWTEALDRILQDAPDAILINPHLSTVKGETILGFLRQEGKMSPVLVVADHLEPDRAENLKALGANGFIQKTDAFYQIAEALSRVLPGFSAKGAPIITDEEFERIMIQRLAEVVDDNYSRQAEQKEPAAKIFTPARPLGLSSLAPTDIEEREIVAKPSASPAIVPSHASIPLPPPPPLQEEERQERRKSGVRRRRRRGGKSGFRRLFLTLFLVCLLAGMIFWISSREVRDFVKRGPPPTPQKR